MADLERQTVAAQLDAAEVRAPGLVVRLVDPAGQWLIATNLEPNSVTGDDPCTVWLAPGRALVVGAAPVGDFVSDVTDGLAVFELEGPAGWDLLAMASSLDPALLAPGRCAQTVFAGVKVVLYQHGAALRLHVERPLAAHVLAWLREAMTALEDPR